jgi:hypothetical protein
VKVESRPAIKAARCPCAGRRAARHRCPTVSSDIPALPPSTKRPSNFARPHTTSPCLWTPPPAPPLHRSRSSSGRHRRPPPRAAAGHFPAPSPATNRAPVSPSSFPTPSPAKPATGDAQFRPEPPPPWPRDYIASLSFFPGCFS